MNSDHKMNKINNINKISQIFKIRKITAISFSFFLFCTSLVYSDNPKLESSNKAIDWLQLMDQGRYPESWDKSSQQMKSKLSKEQWVNVIKSIREPLGYNKGRKLLDQRSSKNPEGLPPGNYMVVYYSSSFDNKANAHELVTLVQDGDDNWNVLTYQVQ